MWRGVLLLSSLIALSSSQGNTRDAVKGQNETLVCESPWAEKVVISWLTKTLGSESFSSLVVPENSPKYTVQSTADKDICGTSVCYLCGGQARCTVSLTIYNLEVKDSGEYKCEMTRYSNSQQGELKFQVDVLDEPDEIFVVKHVTGQGVVRYNFTGDVREVEVPVRRGEEVTIDLKVTNSYPEANIQCSQLAGTTWEKYSVIEGSQPFTLTSVQTLTFTPIQSAAITCRVNLGHQNYQEQTYTIHTDVRYPPEGAVNFRIIKPEASVGQVYELKVDDVLEFECKVQDLGNPRGQVGLLKGSSDVPTTEGLEEKENGVVEFKVSKYEHNGQYRCTVFNELGKVSASTQEEFEVKVIGASPPASTAGLEGGAIAGIVIGVVLLIAIVAVVVWFAMRRKSPNSGGTSGGFAAGGAVGASKGSPKGNEDDGAVMTGVTTETPASRGSVDGLNKKDPYATENNNPYDSAYASVDKPADKEEEDSHLHYADLEHKKEGDSNPEPPPIHRKEDPVIYSQIQHTPPPPARDLQRAGSETQI